MSSINPSSRKMGSPVRGRTQSQKRRAASRSKSPMNPTEKRISSPTSVTESPNGDAVKRIRTNGSIANASAQNTNQNTIICSLSHNELKKDPKGKVNNIDGIQFIDHGDWIQIKEVGLRKNYLKLWIIKCYGDQKPPTYPHNQCKINNNALTCLGCLTKEEYNQNKEVYNVLLKVYENIDNPEKLGEIISEAIKEVPILTIINWLIEYEIKDLEKVKITKENNGLTFKQSLMCFAAGNNNVEAINALKAIGVDIINDPGMEFYDEKGNIKVKYSTLAIAARNNQVNAIVALKAIGVDITNDTGLEIYDEKGNIKEKWSNLALAARFNQVNAINALNAIGFNITNDPGYREYDGNNNEIKVTSALEIAKAENHDSLIELLTSSN